MESITTNSSVPPIMANVTTQPTDDPNAIVYHTRFEMASKPEAGHKRSHGDLGEFGKIIVEIPGIIQVQICPYLLLIHKAPLFEWQEILPKVDSILREFAISQSQLQAAASLRISDLS